MIGGYVRFGEPCCFSVDSTREAIAPYHRPKTERGKGLDVKTNVSEGVSPAGSKPGSNIQILALRIIHACIGSERFHTNLVKLTVLRGIWRDPAGFDQGAEQERAIGFSQASLDDQSAEDHLFARFTLAIACHLALPPSFEKHNPLIEPLKRIRPLSFFRGREIAL
ncbi:hypothetical protein FHT85_003627 [Rhizobium sp. BK312]|nr:hypothetical protein [Rhizobium sp. BK312]